MTEMKQTALAGRGKQAGPQEANLLVDKTRGIMVSPVLGERVIVVTLDFLRALNKALMKTLAPTPSLTLHRAGREYGSKLANYVTGKSTIDAMRFLTKLAASAGWGKFTISDVKGDGSVVRVKVNDSAFLGIMLCSFLQGLISSIADSVLEGEHAIEHRRCQAKGDEHCEFEVTYIERRTDF